MRSLWEISNRDLAVLTSLLQSLSQYGKAEFWDFLMKTKHSGQVCFFKLYGFLLCFCKPVIGLWALQKHNALELAKQSICYIGWRRKEVNVVHYDQFIYCIYNTGFHVQSWLITVMDCSRMKCALYLMLLLGVSNLLVACSAGVFWARESTFSY